MKYPFTLGLEEVTLESLNQVGGKNASLGEMIRNLAPLGINIPNGFAITVDAYREFLRFNNLDDQIHKVLDGLDIDNLIVLRKGGTQIRQLIRNGKFPKEMEEE